MSEDDVKRAVVAWLESDGWSTRSAMKKAQGIDVHATRGDEEWIIEAKGHGKHDTMSRNFFFAVLGQIVHRMSRPDARYAIALPDAPVYRGLWSRLPEYAKKQTGIAVLLVGMDGSVVVHTD